MYIYALSCLYRYFNVNTYTTTYYNNIFTNFHTIIIINDDVIFLNVNLFSQNNVISLLLLCYLFVYSKAHMKRFLNPQ